MTDREKLARETYERVGRDVLDAWDIIAEETRERWRTGADIAIAYADRRVAEAVEWMRDELCMCAPEREIDPEEKECMACSTVPRLLRALSPAREGGSDE